MLRAERQAKILQILREKGFVENNELATLFDVSLVTIRRDIKTLHEQKLIRVEHGGIASVDYLDGGLEPLYETKLYVRQEQKENIAAKAVTFIEDGDTIILDSGTTNFRLALAIRDTHFNNLTVLTTDLMVAKELCSVPNIKVILLGGILRPHFYNAYGPYTELILDNLHADKFFYGADGVSEKHGISSVLLEEVPVKQKMINISDKVILVSDSSKFGSDAPYKVCTWEKINIVISDQELDELYLEFFKNQEISYFPV